ncbi:MAG: MBG domain-containing protein, partial [Caldimonas sp.]
MYEGLTYPLLSDFLTPITVTANDATRIYGQANPAFGVSYSTSPNGNVLGTASFSGTAQTATNVGNYAITPGGLYSNQQGFVISYADGTLSVTPATLTLISNAASRLYGATEPAFSGSVSGFVAGDTLASATSGTETFATNAVVSSNVGNYAITGSGLSANNGNYVFTQAAGNTSALSITPATLTLTSSAATRLYGAADPAFSGSVSGFVAGDTLASATSGTETFSTNA